MQQILIPYETADAGEIFRQGNRPALSSRICEHALLYISLGLLIASTADNGPVGAITKFCWLASVAALSLINIGGAFAVYLSSLAIYAPLHYGGLGSVSQRPDNCAMVIVYAAMLFGISKRNKGQPRFNLYIGAFVVFSVLHFVFFTGNFAALLRDILVPISACSFLAMIGFEKREMEALQNGMAVLGGYMGLVSILERIPAYDWILPPWVGDVSLRPPDIDLESWIGSGRSGGTLLQPAFNGALLSLIFCFLLPRLRRTGSWPTVIAMTLCVIGAFFTYTRAVWLGLALSLIWFPGWCRSFRQTYLRRAFIVGVAAILVVVARGMASERLQDTNNILFRFNLWGAAFRLIEAHPLFGVGFFNFQFALMGVDQGFGSLLPALEFDIQEEGAASHNTLLTVLVEFGAVGFLLYTTTVFQIVRAAARNIGRLLGSPGAAWIISFAIVYVVNAQFVSLFEGAPNTAFFGILGALAGAQIQTFSVEPGRKMTKPQRI